MEEVFGWLSTVAGMRKTTLQGFEQIGWVVTIAIATDNEIRMQNLLAADVEGSSPDVAEAASLESFR